MASLVANKGGLFHRFALAYYNFAGWRKIGLIAEDLYIEEYPEMVETLRRLPPTVLAARDKRLKIASDCTFKKVELPKDQWTTLDMEKYLSYLEPTLSEVKKEFQDRSSFRN